MQSNGVRTIFLHLPFEFNSTTECVNARWLVLMIRKYDFNEIMIIMRNIITIIMRSKIKFSFKFWENLYKDPSNDEIRLW